jgi:hypothetical protein
MKGGIVPGVLYSSTQTDAVEDVPMRYKDSMVENLYHYVNKEMYRACLKFFKKIQIERRVETFDYSLTFSCFWKQKLPVDGSSSDLQEELVILRHNVVMKDVYAPVSRIHREMIVGYMRDNRHFYWA